jgi:hypothetical protein
VSTIKSSSEHLTLNADGAGKDIKFQGNGVEQASISSTGVMTSKRVINATDSHDPWLKGVDTNNNETFSLKQDGTGYFKNKVGVGTTSPTGNLTVKQSAADFYGVVIEESVSDAWLRMGHNGTVGSIETTYNASAGQTPLVFKTSGNEALRIDTAGRVTMPYQPAFNAMGSGSWVTLIPGNYIIPNFGSVSQRGGSNFNISNATFTAPISGWYSFTLSCYTSASSTAAHVYPRLYKNGILVQPGGQIVHYQGSRDADTGSSFTTLVNMAVNEYIQMGFATGAGNCNYHGANTHIQGHLIG